MKQLIAIAFLAAAAFPAGASGGYIWRNRPAGLAGGWDFSGERTTSPTGTSLSLFGNASVASGTRYMALDGSGDYATWTGTAAQNSTLCLWVYKTTTSTECAAQHLRVSGYDTTASGIRLVLGNGFSFFDIYGTAGTLTQANGAAPTINGWTHYAMTYDSGVLKTYQNGTLRNTTAGTNYTLTATGASQIGRWAATGGIFYATGRVAGVLPFTRVLSAEEIAAIYNTGAARVAQGGTP